MQIENLEVGDGGVAGIDLVALGDQGFGKIVSPTGFGAFHLDQRGANHVIAGLRFTTLDEIGNVGEPFVDLLFVARVAAEEEVVHVKAIQHDLIAHGLDGAHALKGRTCVRSRGFLFEARENVHEEQQDEDAKNQAKSRVKLFSDRHCKMPPLTSAGQCKYSRCRNNPSASDGLIGMKFELNNLCGLFRRRHKLPFLYGVLAGLNEQRMTSDDASAFHAPIGGDDHFNLDLARDIHSPG